MVSFTPQILVLGSVPLIVAFLLRARWVLIAVAVFAVWLVVLIAPREIPGPNPDAGGRSVTLMSANLLKGEADPDTIVGLARSNRPTLIALQEVTPEFMESLRSRGLLRTYKYSVGRALPEVFGVVLLSSRPLTEVSTLELNSAGLSKWPEAIVDGLDVKTLHPSPPIKPDQTGRWQDVLAASPSARPAPRGTKRVLVGDFNATLDHKALRALIARGYVDAGDAVGKGLVFTWSTSRFARLTIDHVLVDDRIHVARYDVYNLPGSDHNAVVARIQLP